MKSVQDEIRSHFCALASCSERCPFSKFHLEVGVHCFQSLTDVPLDKVIALVRNNGNEYYGKMGDKSKKFIKQFMPIKIR